MDFFQLILTSYRLRFSGVLWRRDRRWVLVMSERGQGGDDRAGVGTDGGDEPVVEGRGGAGEGGRRERGKGGGGG